MVFNLTWEKVEQPSHFLRLLSYRVKLRRKKLKHKSIFIIKRMEIIFQRYILFIIIKNLLHQIVEGKRDLLNRCFRLHK